MHFWIDKRSNYGIGQNRSLTGLSYPNRRVRNKPMLAPCRPPVPCVPSTSHQHSKSLHPPRTRPSAPENVPVAAPAQSIALNIHHVPVIHPVYVSMEHLQVNHVVESSEHTSHELTLKRCFPIYLKCVLCVSIMLTLLTVKFYEDNNRAGLFWLLAAFGSVSLLLLLLPIMLTNCVCERKRRTTISQNEVVLNPTRNNQEATHDIESLEPPPPYAVAVKLADKAFIPQESPPPSYEKINII